MAVLLVGWDGVERTLVQELLENGELPVLGSIVAHGSWRELDGLPGVGDDAHWSTFATGTGPGVHGRFHYVQPPPGSYIPRMTRRDDRSTVRSFWHTLGSQGVRTLVLDVPKSPFDTSEGVTEVVDWMPHGPDSSHVTSSPPELATELEQRRPHGAFSDCDRSTATQADFSDHNRAVDERRSARTSEIQRLLSINQADLVIAVYAEGHCVGHHSWHIHEPKSTADRTLSDALGDPVVSQLKSLDSDLGRLITQVGDVDRVCVFSLTGMGPAIDADTVVRATLEQLNRHWLRARPRAHMRSALVRFKWWLKGSKERVPSSTAFYPVSSNIGGTAIRLNLEGREPRGLVQGDDLKATLVWLRDRLMEMVDDEGQPILKEVLLMGESYPGPRHDAHADLVAMWAIDRPKTATTSITAVTVEPATTWREGDHVSGGWLAAGSGLDVPDRLLQIEELAGFVGSWLSCSEDRPVAYDSVSD